MFHRQTPAWMFRGIHALALDSLPSWCPCFSLGLFQRKTSGKLTTAMFDEEMTLNIHFLHPNRYAHWKNHGTFHIILRTWLSLRSLWQGKKCFTSKNAVVHCPPRIIIKLLHDCSYFCHVLKLETIQSYCARKRTKTSLHVLPFLWFFYKPW